MKDTVINLYDFDYTIYDGDCTLDFYFFCLRHDLTLARYLPYQLTHFLLYVFKLEKRTAFKSNFFIFIPSVKNLEARVEEFWERNHKKIKQWYLDTEPDKDVIISASPTFLLEPAFRKLQAHTLIATDLDIQTGRIIGENCRGQEKVTRLEKMFGIVGIVDKVYSDSLSDMPILKLAKQPFIVRGNKRLPLGEYLAMTWFRRLFLTKK